MNRRRRRWQGRVGRRRCGRARAAATTAAATATATAGQAVVVPLALLGRERFAAASTATTEIVCVVPQVRPETVSAVAVVVLVTTLPSMLVSYPATPVSSWDACHEKLIDVGVEEASCNDAGAVGAVVSTTAAGVLPPMSVRNPPIPAFDSGEVGAIAIDVAGSVPAALTCVLRAVASTPCAGDQGRTAMMRVRVEWFGRSARICFGVVTPTMTKSAAAARASRIAWRGVAARRAQALTFVARLEQARASCVCAEAVVGTLRGSMSARPLWKAESTSFRCAVADQRLRATMSVLMPLWCRNCSVEGCTCCGQATSTAQIGRKERCASATCALADPATRLETTITTIAVHRRARRWP